MDFGARGHGCGLSCRREGGVAPPQARSKIPLGLVKRGMRARFTPLEKRGLLGRSIDSNVRTPVQSLVHTHLECGRSLNEVFSPGRNTEGMDMGIAGEGIPE